MINPTALRERNSQFHIYTAFEIFDERLGEFSSVTYCRTKKGSISYFLATRFVSESNWGFHASVSYEYRSFSLSQNASVEQILNNHLVTELGALDQVGTWLGQWPLWTWPPCDAKSYWYAFKNNCTAFLVLILQSTWTRNTIYPYSGTHPRFLLQ